MFSNIPQLFPNKTFISRILITTPISVVMILLVLSRHSITQEWLDRRTKPAISVGQHVVGKETHTGGVIPFQRERWIRVNWHPTIQTRRADVCSCPSPSSSPVGAQRKHSSRRRNVSSNRAVAPWGDTQKY